MTKEFLETGQVKATFLFVSGKSPRDLFYFCPDQEGAGGKILVKDASDYNKPNQRTDLLLTFTYGQPTKYYQILVKEALLTNRGPLFFERPQWIGEVVRPVGTATLPFPSPSDSQSVDRFYSGRPESVPPLVPFPEDSVLLTVEPLALALQDSFRIPKPFHPVFFAL